MTDPADRGPKRPFFTCVVPFAVFILGGLLEPVPSGGGLAGLAGLPYDAYPIVYFLRVCATVAAIAICLPNLAGWLGRPAWWPPVLGVALVVPWIVLAGLQRESGLASVLTERSGFNPFEQFGDDSWQGRAFLAVRFFGLAAVVPLVEELFLRGFLMRFVIREEFWKVPFGTLTLASATACTAYAAVTHPAELAAAVGWFAIVSGIAAATSRPIDCILAHAGTNLALGIYVLATGAWWLL